MTIASEIQRINTNISNAYTALEEKGVTMPAKKNSDNLASTINALEVGGDESWIKDVIEGTTTELKLSSSITKIRDYAFYAPNTSTYQYLTSIEGDGVEEVGKNSLTCQTKLQTINLPNCKKVGDWGLVTAMVTASAHTNNNLSTIILGELESIGSSAFQGVFKKTTQTRNFKFKNCVIGSSAFAYNSFTELDLSGVVSIGQNAFYNNSAKLTKVWLPSSVTTITAPDNFAGALFSGVATGCTIYTDIPSADDVPSTWGVGWKYSRGTELAVVYGATYEDFLNA